MSQTGYFVQDSFIPDDQKYVCLSFLTDKENKNTLNGIKVRGVFPTYELACEHAKKIQGIDPYFHVFVGDVGKWLPFDPNPDSEYVKNSEYANEQLNNLMKGYLENQEKAKIYHEQRKTEMIRQNIMDNLTSKQDNLSSLNKKLKKVENEDEKVDLKTKIEIIEDQIKKMEEKKGELDGKITDLNNQIKSFNSNMSEPTIIDNN